MKKLNKILIVSLVLLIVLAASITAYAFTVRTPAEIVADLTGKGTEEVAEIRYESGKTYGQIAYDESEETWEQFRDEMFENRKAFIEERVKDGTLTQEEADEILENFEVMQENCLGAGGGYGMGRGLGMMRNQFGNGSGFGNGGRGIGFGAGRCGRGSW
ncbi:MAG: DUF2680 domain-containing protein [Tissierellia bacterium]|nr:DUF2680 domain-containing protein [Tissierellia bacterium]MDD4439686.1 DUF2680 domain-containing protein [Tissierellia bacterium]